MAIHHANQLNPNNIAHKLSTDNYANQKSPTSPAYQKRERQIRQTESRRELLCFSLPIST